IGLLLECRQRVDVPVVDETPRDPVEPKIENVVTQRAADQKFHRQVINALRILAIIGVLGAVPALGKDVPYRARDRFVTFSWPDLGGIDAAVEHQMPLVKRIVAPGESDRAAAILFQKLRQLWCGRPCCPGHGVAPRHDLSLSSLRHQTAPRAAAIFPVIRQPTETTRRGLRSRLSPQVHRGSSRGCTGSRYRAENAVPR